MLEPAPRLIIMIGDDGVVAVPVAIKEAAASFVSFTHDDALQEVLAFTAHYPEAELILFADNLAQDYRIDKLLRLNFFDRKSLVERRLRQNFSHARLCASLRFRRIKNQILLIGLHESNALFTFADRLRDRLPCVALLPVEGAAIAARLAPETAKGWAMLVSRQQSGGIRQIVTYKNELVFTRLTPLPGTDDPDSYADIIARDIQASVDYLKRQALQSGGDLSVVLLQAGSVDHQRIARDIGLRSLVSFTPYEAARILKLPFAPDIVDGYADILFAACLAANRHPRLPLMLPEARQKLATRRLKSWGMRTACLCLFLALLRLGLGANEFVSTLSQTRHEAAILHETRQKLAQTQAGAAPLTEPLGRMRQALERRRIYETPGSLPWHGMNEMLKEPMQAVKIVKLDWEKENDETAESFILSVRMPNDQTDRAEGEQLFAEVAQSLAQNMPDYTMTVVKPPYPSLPQESVSASPQKEGQDPVGEISLTRTR